MICPNCSYRDDPPDREWTLRFKKALLSLNKVGTNGLHKSPYKGQRSYYMRKFAAWASEIPRAETFRQVFITRHYRSVSKPGGGKGSRPCRPFDYDNMVGGCKPLLDALKTSGHLLDDNPKSVAVCYSQVPSGDRFDYIQVTVQEFDTDA